MALSGKATVAVAVMAAAVLLMFAGEASALTCGQVDSTLAPCVGYATGREKTLSPRCCNGVRSLNGLARSTPDRKMACGCLKKLAGSIKAIDMGKVSGVPGKCGVSVPFPIALSTDCNKYVYISVLEI
ncbi:hypothetical protein ACQ4PT_068391 [Festuca glaucescens]